MDKVFFIYLVCIYKPGSVPYLWGDKYLSRIYITIYLKRFRLWPKPENTILHTRKYFAVSPELNRFVTVRNSILTDDGRYPLRLPGQSQTVCPDFPHSSFRQSVIYPIQTELIVAEIQGLDNSTLICYTVLSEIKFQRSVQFILL